MNKNARVTVLYTLLSLSKQQQPIDNWPLHEFKRPFSTDRILHIEDEERCKHNCHGLEKVQPIRQNEVFNRHITSIERCVSYRNLNKYECIMDRQGGHR